MSLFAKPIHDIDPLSAKSLFDIHKLRTGKIQSL